MTSRPPTTRVPRLIIQPRDRAILRFIFHHRFLTSAHIHQLAFFAKAKRLAQRRLGRLKAARLLACTQVCLGASPERTVVYSLTRQGAALVAEDTGLPLRDIPHTKAQNAKGFATLAHHLVATDVLVAVSVAALRHPDLSLVAVDREHHLRARLGRFARTHGLARPHLVSDGAFTLKRQGTERTCHIEVVRSPIAGGSARYIEKLGRWLQAIKDGYPTRVWEHAPIGALLTLTTSPGRTRNLMQAAASLEDPGHLLWFGTYDPKYPLIPETILTHVFFDASGTSQTLLGKTVA